MGSAPTPCCEASEVINSAVLRSRPGRLRVRSSGFDAGVSFQRNAPDPSSTPANRCRGHGLR
eukprot:4848991-Alexandrium_andersonii.AAC.1